MKTTTKSIIRLLLIFIAFVMARSISTGQTTVTFNCTGAAQTWVVPACVTSINVTVEGAQGGGTAGGLGAVVTGTLAVTPGQTLQINVGCSGACPGTGFNGGGNGSTASGAGNASCGGGGASDIRITPYALGNRIVVAGGGGGTGGGDTDGMGGDGGCAAGIAGTSPFGQGGAAGTATAGGAGGPPWNTSGNTGGAGALGTGGAGASDPCFNLGPGGGGGGGYYGGGGGGSDCYGSAPLGGGGGGGGSSLTPAGGGCTPATNTGAGVVTINYTGGAAVITVNSPTICNGQTANLTASGATSYTWSAGATSTGVNTANASPAVTTTYTVTGTTSGCTGTAISTVTVNPSPTVIPETNLTYCAGDAVPANTFASTPGGATFTWTNSNTAIGLAASGTTSLPAFTAANASGTPITSTISITPTLAGCTGPASIFTITVNPIPVTTVNSPTICPGNTASLIASGANTYTWTAGATSTGANTADASPAATTTYTVTGSSSGCSSTAVSTVTVGSSITPNAGLNDTICFGGSTVLNVTPNGAGYSYSWTPSGSLVGATTFNPTASPAATTTYSVLVTDAGGCTGTSTVTIYADPQITMAIAGIDVTCNGACNGQTIVIPGGGTPAYTYLWSSGCVAASCTSLCPGSYTVTVTDSWGCTATSSANVTEPTLFTASITASAPASCNGICDGTATAAGNGGTPGTGYTYSWNSMPVQNTAVASGLCTGSYICTLTDANSCTATTTVTIAEPTVVVIAPIVSPIICFGGTVNIVAIASGGNGGPYAYTWSPATGLDFTNIPNPNASPVGTTVYTVNATDVNGCAAAPVNVTVTVNPPLTVVAAGTASICPGASTPISAIAANGSGGPYTYSWSPAAGLSATNIANPSASPAVTTTYTVTASDGCSPTATATVTVIVLPLPVVSFSATATSGCEPLCLTLINNSTVAGGSIATWLWDYGDGSIADTAHYHCYAVAGQYSVSLTVTSSPGGCVSTLTTANMITVHPTPDAAFTAPQSTSIINPTVNFSDFSAYASSWNWNFGDIYAGADSVSTLQNPSHNYTEAGTYCVTLKVISPFGCVDSTELCIVIDPEFTFFIPNGFSPNDDGFNDEFYGKGDFITDYEMFIYDRWGNLIFFSDDINKHWDGKANNGSEVSEQDVYVYVVKIEDHKNKKHKYIGTVTIVK